MLADVSSICLTMPLHGEVDLINIALFFLKIYSMQGVSCLFILFYFFIFDKHTPEMQCIFSE
jgi:hypothetical protein